MLLLFALIICPCYAMLRHFHLCCLRCHAAADIAIIFAAFIVILFICRDTATALHGYDAYAAVAAYAMLRCCALVPPFADFASIRRQLRR